MKLALAAAAAVVALGAAPAIAQNSAPLSPFNVPLSNGGQRNLDAPGLNGADANVSGAANMPDRGWTAGGANTAANAGSNLNASGSNLRGSTETTTTASADPTPAPSSYPVCRTRAQDRCRVPASWC